MFTVLALKKDFEGLEFTLPLLDQITIQYYTTVNEHRSDQFQFCSICTGMLILLNVLWFLFCQHHITSATLMEKSNLLSQAHKDLQYYKSAQDSYDQNYKVEKVRGSHTPNYMYI